MTLRSSVGARGRRRKADAADSTRPTRTRAQRPRRLDHPDRQPWSEQARARSDGRAASASATARTPLAGHAHGRTFSACGRRIADACGGAWPEERAGLRLARRRTAREQRPADRLTLQRRPREGRRSAEPAQTDKAAPRRTMLTFMLVSAFLRNSDPDSSVPPSPLSPLGCVPRFFSLRCWLRPLHSSLRLLCARTAASAASRCCPSPTRISQRQPNKRQGPSGACVPAVRRPTSCVRRRERRLARAWRTQMDPPRRPTECGPLICGTSGERE